MKSIIFLFPLFFSVVIFAQQEEVIEIVEVEEVKSNDSNETFEFVEVQPEFKGGMQAMYEFLGEEVAYPMEALEKGIQGKVYVKFIVTKSGKIEGVKIVRGVNELLDREALRAIMAMPKWKPGEQRGKKVNVWFTIPVSFKISEPPKEE